MTTPLTTDPATVGAGLWRTGNFPGAGCKTRLQGATRARRRALDPSPAAPAARAGNFRRGGL